MLAFLLFAAAAAAGPHPSDPRLFKDWTVACDNGRACEAIALIPTNAEPGDWLTLRVERGGAPGARPRLSLASDESGEEIRPASLWADGKKLPVRFGADAAVGEGSEAVVAALRSAGRLEARDGAGHPLGLVSLAGASAALLYMDDRQQRVGTATALARPGPKPATAVPPPPAYPVVKAAAGSKKPPRRLAKAEWTKRRNEACGEVQPADEAAPDFYRLDAAHSLASIPVRCLSGAYNAATLLLVAGETGPWRPPAYDYPVDSGGEAGDGTAYNADWSDKDGALFMFMKGRGLGDCGTRERFVWDGARFRLVDQARLDECRGSTEWLPTWHAEVRR
ncbi:MAG: DUF1176 domain-containing protein [Allosphingosinicella sp.]